MRFSSTLVPLVGAALLGALAPTAARAQTQDLFVSNGLGANGNTNIILRFAGTGPGNFSTTPTTLTDPSLNDPQGLAVDARGDLFVGNGLGGPSGNGNTITEFPAGATPGTFGPTTTFTAPSLDGQEGLAVDARGDLFAASINNRSITEFPVAATPGTFGPSATFTDPRLNQPGDLAFDGLGDLFVVNTSDGSNGAGTGSIIKFAFSPGGNGPGTLGPGQVVETGLDFPVGLAFGPSVSAPVPEASTTVSLGLMMALGMGGLAVAGRRRKA